MGEFCVGWGLGLPFRSRGPCVSHEGSSRKHCPSLWSAEVAMVMECQSGKLTSITDDLRPFPTRFPHYTGCSAGGLQSWCRDSGSAVTFQGLQSLPPDQYNQLGNKGRESLQVLTGDSVAQPRRGIHNLHPHSRSKNPVSFPTYHRGGWESQLVRGPRREKETSWVNT